jgi:hypothetical protein
MARDSYTSANPRTDAVLEYVSNHLPTVEHRYGYMISHAMTLEWELAKAKNAAPIERLIEAAVDAYNGQYQVDVQINLVNATRSYIELGVTPPPGPSGGIEGWKLVPIAPTKEMLKAGDSVASSVNGGPFYRPLYPAGVGPEDVYAAMIHASPPATTGGNK